ncbi:MAG: ABC transporter permease, partial [Candidatus Bathyarchaeota archaeon]|nr:ABC transporter permease [Candidatus Bathyarchaeota archaeon]
YARYTMLETKFAIFATASAVAVFGGAILLDKWLLKLITFRFFQLSKRFLKARKTRYALTLFSISTYAASITVLSSALQPHTLFFLSGIVICIIANTMLGNIHQRRKEMFTLATAGLNPDHFTGLLLAEAFVLSFIGGGIGYSAGLYAVVLYSLPVSMFELSAALMAGVILISAAVAFIASVLPALKASMAATPSLLKRWWREAPPSVGWPPRWTFTIPVKVTEETAEEFVYFYMKRLTESERLFQPIERAYDLVFDIPSVEQLPKLKFKYFMGDGTYMLETDNELRLLRSADSEELQVDFTITVVGYNDPGYAQRMDRYLQEMASTFRMLAFEWTR